MLDREPFLRAIFAAPGDDLPRLVFADYLDEHSNGEWAELIRIQCELAALGRRTPDQLTPTEEERLLRLGERGAALSDAVYPGHDREVPSPLNVDRGFRVGSTIAVSADDLADPDAFRLLAVTRHPEWYGAVRLKVTDGRLTSPGVRLKVTDGRLTSPGPLVTVLAGPVTERVSELDLSGRTIETPVVLPDVPADVDLDLPAADLDLAAFEIETRPSVTVPVVETLAQMREARRLTDLDLTNNDLDNDAARALARSPHLFRLRRLALYHGNRLKARTWQQLTERFGDVLQ